MDKQNARLVGDDLTLAYDEKVISKNLSVSIPNGSFTVIVGENGCGKSTLLRCLSRILKPTSGTAYLDGRSIADIRSKDFARQVGLLPQSPKAPDGITVEELVSRGRYPHQNLFSRPGKKDREAVFKALEETGTSHLSDQLVGQLSGGQRQRVWIAIALAQETSILLLDEPTTYLDIANQIELMDLFAKLNKNGRTLVAVLHDLNQAARYATHMIAMKDGVIAYTGSAAEVLTEQRIAHLYGMKARIIDDPISHTPLVVPYSQTNR